MNSSPFSRRRFLETTALFASASLVRSETPKLAAKDKAVSFVTDWLDVVLDINADDVDRIGAFRDAGAPVDSFAVGSYISKASPIDFTGDLKEIDGRAVAKRGRIPGRTESPRLERIDLARPSGG